MSPFSAYFFLKTKRLNQRVMQPLFITDFFWIKVATDDKGIKNKH